MTHQNRPLAAALLALFATSSLSAARFQVRLSFNDGARVAMPAGVDAYTWGRRVLEENTGLSAALKESPEYTGRRIAATCKVLEILQRSGLRNQMVQAQAVGGRDLPLRVEVKPLGHFEETPAYSTTLSVPGALQVLTVSVPFLVRNKYKAEAFSEAMIHEAAHAGDHAGCSAEAHKYGRNNRHGLLEVMSPRGAFLEGWANYLASRSSYDGAISDKVQRSAAPKFLVADVAGGGSEKIEWQDLELYEVASNEVMVARFLQAAEDASSFEAVAAAFRRSATSECRSLADFFGAFSRSNPGAKSAVARKIWSQVSKTYATTTQVKELVLGRFSVANGYRPANHEMAHPGLDFFQTAVGLEVGEDVEVPSGGTGAVYGVGGE